MSFRENLLKKLEIDRLADRIRKTVAPAASEVRLDKELMRQLLALSTFEHRQERDLDLYTKETGEGDPLVLVLDNELPIYKTGIADVVLRKSPYPKEMLSIRNIVKILKDSDVKISRKEDSLETVRADCLAGLDLSYTTADIENIAYDGAASLESKYPEGVIENLALFAELTGFEPPPAPFKSKHHVIFGKLVRNAGGGVEFGPMVIYDRVRDSLLLMEETLSGDRPEEVEHYREILDARRKPAVSGAGVFDYLKHMVLSKK